MLSLRRIKGETQNCGRSHLQQYKRLFCAVKSSRNCFNFLLVFFLLNEKLGESLDESYWISWPSLVGFAETLMFNTCYVGQIVPQENKKKGFY